MLTIRKSRDRGHFDHGWLKTFHTFSFADYHDPNYMGFRQLRVINEDWVQPGEGFGTHPHRDMEIITVVREGALEHKDSMGTGSVIRPGEVQVMSAGTGVTHSEFNHSATEAVHLLQIWIVPERRGLTPGYQQKTFGKHPKPDGMCLLVSKDGQEGSLKMNQDAMLWLAELNARKPIEYSLKDERFGWLQVLSGHVLVNGQAVGEGDGIAIAQERKLTISAEKQGEFLLFDLA